MSAINWYAHSEKAWSDQPECVDPVIRSICIWLNDHTPESEMERVIGPHIFMPLGTWLGLELALSRAYRVADFAIREIAPMALNIETLNSEATTLESLTPITDRLTAEAAVKTAEWIVIQSRAAAKTRATTKAGPRAIVVPLDALGADVTNQAAYATSIVADASRWAPGQKAVGKLTEATLKAVSMVIDAQEMREVSESNRPVDVRHMVLDLIRELCEMGREEPRTYRTKEQTLECLETGRFNE